MYTENGRQSFDAERGREGHADRFWAAALALHASDDALLPLQPNEVKTRYCELNLALKKQFSEWKSRSLLIPLCFAIPVMEVVRSLELALRSVTSVTEAVRYKPRFVRFLARW
jgi:hypothetical protein